MRIGGVSLLQRILQLEREQKADEVRIDDAIKTAENNIAALTRKHLSREEMRKASLAIRDRTVLIIRDVRKNMQTRQSMARNMQDSLIDGFRKRSCFAKDDVEDVALRCRFFELLQDAPTHTLIYHLQEAIKVSNLACVENIQFEFKCRNDRHEYAPAFEALAASLSHSDPVKVWKRLANVRKAAEKVDTRITALLQLVRSLPESNSSTQASQEMH